MSLITACAIFCSLKFHIVCTCNFFGHNICLLTNRKMIKIVTLIDLHIVLTYDCWHCFLVFNIWASHALEMTINFYYPTLTLELFLINLFLPQNVYYPTLFSSVPTPPPPSPPPTQTMTTPLVRSSCLYSSNNFMFFCVVGRWWQDVDRLWRYWCFQIFQISTFPWHEIMKSSIILNEAVLALTGKFTSSFCLQINLFSG
jgi:hypothetical protein